MEHIDVLERAFASVKSDWPFANIGINLETVGAKFEGILRFIFLEYHLRYPSRARKTMQDEHFHESVHSIHATSVLVGDAHYFSWEKCINHLVSQRNRS